MKTPNYPTIFLGMFRGNPKLLNYLYS